MATVLYPLGQFPPAVIDWLQLIPLLGPSSAAVARYDGTLAAVPNAAVLLSPLTAVLDVEAKGDGGRCAWAGEAAYRKLVCGSISVETEPQKALLLTLEPQVREPKSRALQRPKSKKVGANKADGA